MLRLKQRQAKGKEKCLCRCFKGSHCVNRHVTKEMSFKEKLKNTVFSYLTVVLSACNILYVNVNDCLKVTDFF